MKEQILKASRKHLRSTIIFVSILLVIALAVSAPVWFGYITGPKSLDGVSGDKFDNYTKKYVEIEVQYVLAEYCERTVRKQGSATSRATNNGYYIYDEKTNTMYGIYVEHSEESKFKKLIDQTWDYLEGSSDKKPDTIKVKGTLRKMKDKELKYYQDIVDDCADNFNDWFSDDYNTLITDITNYAGASEAERFGQVLESYMNNSFNGNLLDELKKYYNDEFSEYCYGLFSLYHTANYGSVELTIDTGKINNEDSSMFLISMLFAVPLLIVLIVNIIKYNSGSGYKAIKKFADKNNISEQELEQQFNSAEVFGGTIYVSEKYTFCGDTAKWYVFKNDDLVWAYYFHQSGRYPISRVNAYHYDKSVSYINTSREVAEEILKYYMVILPKIVVGYTKELEKDFRKDYNAFLSLRYNAPQDMYSQEYSDGTESAAAQNTYSSQSEYTEAGEYQVKFVSVGDTPIVVIKDIREMFGLGLAEAKEIVDAAGVIRSNVSYKAAENIKNVLEKEGSVVEIVNM